MSDFTATELPVSPGVHRYHPLKEEMRKARAALEAARRRHDEADALTGDERFAAILSAEVDLDDAEKALKAVQADMDRYGDAVPTYLILARSYRDDPRWQAVQRDLPPWPGDMAMIRALKKDAEGGALEEETAAAVKRLAAAARSHGNISSSPLANEFSALVNEALECGAPSVREVMDKRLARGRALTEASIRFHVKGWEGGAAAAFPPLGKDGLADASIMDAIPRTFHVRLIEKIEELASLGEFALASSGEP